jgi:hypothetical protein
MSRCGPAATFVVAPTTCICFPSYNTIADAGSNVSQQRLSYPTKSPLKDRLDFAVVLYCFLQALPDLSFLVQIEQLASFHAADLVLPPVTTRMSSFLPKHIYGHWSMSSPLACTITILQSNFRTRNRSPSALPCTSV